MILEARGLGLDIGKRHILQNVDLSIQRGSLVCITGPSGSGKSTLLHCLSGLMTPSRGEVWARGERMDDKSERGRAKWRLRHFGFVFQFSELLPELTLRENVELPLRLLGHVPIGTYARVDELMDRLDIAGVQHQHPLAVSGGEAQRAAIARALVHRPDVVFADEPTGALDQRNGERVIEALRSLVDQDDVAVVMVTHNEQIAVNSDHRVRLLDGCVATTSQLLT